jgi:hypothetical protein
LSSPEFPVPFMCVANLTNHVVAGYYPQFVFIWLLKEDWGLKHFCNFLFWFPCWVLWFLVGFCWSFWLFSLEKKSGLLNEFIIEIFCHFNLLLSLYLQRCDFHISFLWIKLNPNYFKSHDRIQNVWILEFQTKFLIYKTHNNIPWFVCLNFDLVIPLRVYVPPLNEKELIFGIYWFHSVLEICR